MKVISYIPKSVIMNPGAYAFTVILCEASSSASRVIGRCLLRSSLCIALLTNSLSESTDGKFCSAVRSKIRGP